jgi:hypothetical protein
MTAGITPQAHVPAVMAREPGATQAGLGFCSRSERATASAARRDAS